MRALYDQNQPSFTRSVGVAPGTITIKLGGLGEIVAPDEVGWYTTLNTMPEYADQYGPLPASQPKTHYDPYQDIVALKGLSNFPGMGTPPGVLHVWKGNPTTEGKKAGRDRAYAILNRAPLGATSGVRWDLVFGVGGGLLLAATLAGLLARRR